MPPKSRVTREKIVEAAAEVVRESGVEAVNARAVAKKLNCSTQPVMYHFATMEDLKREVYTHVDRYHTEYLMRSSGERDPLLEIGLNYIRFAIEEPRLFRFLFQSGYARESNLGEMLDSEELFPILSAMQGGIGLDMERTKQVFRTVALFAHGYASLIANNNLRYDEDTVAADLERAFAGAVTAVGQEDKNEEVL